MALCGSRGSTEWTEHVAAAWTFPLQTGSDRLACRVSRNARVALRDADESADKKRITGSAGSEHDDGGEAREATIAAAPIV